MVVDCMLFFDMLMFVVFVCDIGLFVFGMIGFMFGYVVYVLCG